MTNILTSPRRFFSDIIRNYNENQRRKSENKKYLADIWEAIQNDPTIEVGPAHDMKSITYAGVEGFVKCMRKLREKAKSEGRLEDIERKIALAEKVNYLPGDRIDIPSEQLVFQGAFTRVHDHPNPDYSNDREKAVEERIHEIILLMNEDANAEYLVYRTGVISNFRDNSKWITIFDLYRA